MSTGYRFPNIIGTSRAIEAIRIQMADAIDSDTDVLITGETGTGKELVAKEIHHNSLRKEHPLLVCNCNVVSRDVLLNQLLGHGKGAFPGAIEGKIGLFEAAEGGTLILDEIDHIPRDIQPSLLRVLEERKVQRLGETTSRSIDMRVIAISNRNLPELVEAGRFLFDLCTRLKAFEIHLPPLRERLGDIPLLVEHFYQEACLQLRRASAGFATDAIEMLSRCPWPGNVRELRSVIRRVCALAGEGECIQTHHLPSQFFAQDVNAK